MNLRRILTLSALGALIGFSPVYGVTEKEKYRAKCVIPDIDRDWDICDENENTDMDKWNEWYKHSLEKMNKALEETNDQLKCFEKSAALKLSFKEHDQLDCSRPGWQQRLPR